MTTRGRTPSPPDILVIEDDRALCDTVSLCLQENGYRVRQASNGYTGLRFAQQRTPSLLLLDLRLPEMNGPSLIGALRRERSTHAVPIVVMTGSPDLLSSDERRTCAAILPKPFGIDQLLALVRRALERRPKPTPVQPTHLPFHGRLGLPASAPTAHAAEEASAHQLD